MLQNVKHGDTVVQIIGSPIVNCAVVSWQSCSNSLVDRFNRQVDSFCVNFSSSRRCQELAVGTTNIQHPATFNMLTYFFEPIFGGHPLHFGSINEVLIHSISIRRVVIGFEFLHGRKRMLLLKTAGNTSPEMAFVLDEPPAKVRTFAGWARRDLRACRLSFLSN